MEMIDITKPTILGCELTLWFWIFCLCFVGIIVCAILVYKAFLNRDKKEQEIIKRSVKNTPIRGMNIDGSYTEHDIGYTESIYADKNETEGFATAQTTEGFADKTENTDVENGTEGLYGTTEGLNSGTKGLHNTSSTESFLSNNRTESFADENKTEAF